MKKNRVRFGSSQRNSFRKIWMIMKLISFILLVGTLQLSATVYSQNSRLTIKVKEAALVDVFEQITSNSGYTFVFNAEEVKEKKPVTVEVKNGSIQQVLELLLKNQQLKYSIVDNVVVISTNKEVASAEVDQDQKKTLKGHVLDGLSKEPMVGVNVYIKGTTLGTITDINGEFEFNVPEDSKILVISFIGFTTQEIEIENKTIFSIQLNPEVSEFKEVVVNGYQAIAKERTTGSFGLVKSEQLENEFNTDIRSKLDGKMSGVLINKEGGNTTIQIRGQSTFTATQDPLIVVDGLPIEGGWESIETNDVESITVLKDAASAAIWGTRAANGVIVVTTKSSTRRDKNNAIDVNVSTTIGDQLDLNDLQLASSADLVDFEYRSYYNDVINKVNQKQFHTGVSPVYYLFLDKPANITQQLNSLKNIDHTKQVEDLFMQKSMIHQANIAFQNRSGKNAFFVSINTRFNRGNMKGFSGQRFNLNLKDHFQISDKVSFDLGLTSTLMNNLSNGISVNNITRRKPYELILGENDEYLHQTSGWDIRWIRENRGEDKGYQNWDYNLLREFENMDNRTESMSNRLTTALNYTPVSGLELSTSYLYEIINSENRNHQNQNRYNTINDINRFTTFDEDNQSIIERQFPLGGIITLLPRTIKSFTWRNIAKYNKNWGDDHRLNVMLGTEMREYVSDSRKEVAVGYDDQSLVNQQLLLQGYVEDFRGQMVGFPTSYRKTFSYRKERHLSYFSNFSYSLFGKYTLTASARVDKTNLFGVNKRYRNNPLWSVGGKWNMMKEGFLPDFVNRLELRASYGYTANINRTAKHYATARYQISVLGEEYLQMASPKNNELGFEKTGTFNIGMDYAVLNNKISGSIEYFNKKSVDLLGNIANDPTTGWNNIFSNYAGMSNKGLELVINSTLINHKDVRWEMGFNFTTVKNRVDNISTILDGARYFTNGGSYSAKVGKPISSLYNYKSAGINNEGEFMTYKADGSVVNGTSAYFLNYEDLVWSGQTDPVYFGGLTSSVSYKKFNLSLNFTYKGGHVYRMPVPSYRDAVTMSNTHKSIAQSWTQSGDENKAGVLPKASGLDIYSKAWYEPSFWTDNRVFDASHIRFRNAILSYRTTFGSEQQYKTSFFVEVENIAVFTKNKLDIDPDYASAYSGELRFRQPMTFTLGIKTSF